MGSTHAQTGVIPAGSVQRGTHPVIIDCGGGGETPMAIIPLVEGDHLAGLEIRCQCGANIVLECVYDAPAKPEEDQEVRGEES